MPQKKYIVRLTAQEREICRETIRKLNGSSEKVRRAQMLVKADADGPAWTDQQIADAFSCRTKTVENVRQRCVLEGFEQALERKRREGRIPDFPVTRSHPPASWPSAANSSICRTYRKTAGEESRRRSPVANRWMRP